MAVVIIISALALAVNHYGALPERARNARRRFQLAELNHAIELYHADNSVYPTTDPLAGGNQPTTANFAYNDTFNGGYTPIFTSNYIGNLIPNYFSSLPKDPLPGPSTDSNCSPLGWQRNIIYISNGTNFKLIYRCASEGFPIPDTDPLADPGSCSGGLCYAWAVSNDPTATALW